MKKKSILLIIKVALFLTILVFLVNEAGFLLKPYDGEQSRQAVSFYASPKDSVDVLIVGASTLRNGISPNELWNNYGIVAYTRGDSRQIPEIARFNLQDTLISQKPKLLIISVNSLFEKRDYNENEPFIRRGMDYKRLSVYKLRAIYDIVNEDKSQTFISYIFPVLRYHTRWKEYDSNEVQKNREPDHDFKRGQIVVTEVRRNKVPDLDSTDKTKPPYDEYAADVYRDTIAIAKSHNIKVLIATMPDTHWTYGKYLASKEFAEENDVDYIDFNTKEITEEIGLDWTKDLYDRHHLNLVGTRKASKYMGKLLVEKYGIPQYKCDKSLTKEMNDNYKKYEDLYQDFYDNVYSKGIINNKD